MLRVLSLGPTYEPGILGRIFAELWPLCESFCIWFSAANLEQSSESWYRLRETYLPLSSPDTRPGQLWRRSLSCRTGTCLAPEKGSQRLVIIRSEYKILSTAYSFLMSFHNTPSIIFIIIEKERTRHVMKFLTLISVFSRFLHTSFLSVAIMSDFVISTRYLLKKSGYVHLEIP